MSRGSLRASCGKLRKSCSLNSSIIFNQSYLFYQSAIFKRGIFLSPRGTYEEARSLLRSVSEKDFSYQKSYREFEESPRPRISPTSGRDILPATPLIPRYNVQHVLENDK